MPVLAQLPERNHFLLVAQAASYGHYIIPNYKRQGSVLALSFPMDQREPVKTTLPFASPWRVVMVSPEHPGRIVESSLLENLNPATEPALRRADWIRPGRASWDFIAGGGNEPARVDRLRRADGLGVPLRRRRLGTPGAGHGRGDRLRQVEVEEGGGRRMGQGGQQVDAEHARADRAVHEEAGRAGRARGQDRLLRPARRHRREDRRPRGHPGPADRARPAVRERGPAPPAAGVPRLPPSLRASAAAGHT